MGKRRRASSSPNDIPSNPTANITGTLYSRVLAYSQRLAFSDAMRADAAREGPEEFENLNVTPINPPKQVPRLQWLCASVAGNLGSKTATNGCSQPRYYARTAERRPSQRQRCGTRLRTRGLRHLVAEQRDYVVRI